MGAQIYTTKLDRSKAGISEKDAARIAREIEGKKTSNPHLAEERGQIAYREAVILQYPYLSSLANSTMLIQRISPAHAVVRPQADPGYRQSAKIILQTLTGQASS